MSDTERLEIMGIPRMLRQLNSETVLGIEQAAPYHWSERMFVRENTTALIAGIPSECDGRLLTAQHTLGPMIWRGLLCSEHPIGIQLL